MDISSTFLENGKPQTIIDYYSIGYEVPTKDNQQDWVLHKSKSKIVEEMHGDPKKLTNITEFYFSRKLNTGDHLVFFL